MCALIYSDVTTGISIFRYLIDTISWAAKGNCTKTELLDIVRLVTRAQPTPLHLELWYVCAFARCLCCALVLVDACVRACVRSEVCSEKIRRRNLIEPPHYRLNHSLLACRPKAKKIYQKFGKLVEKGVDDFFREQELQINAIRIEAILNGEKVHDVETMRGRLRKIFSRLQYVLSCFTNHTPQTPVANSAP